MNLLNNNISINVKKICMYIGLKARYQSFGMKTNSSLFTCYALVIVV